nr:hypothetical protein [uncultured bacterium]
MIASVADTHALVWYLAGDRCLSAVARTHMDEAIARGDQIAVSAITLIELIYLTEKGRIASIILDRIMELLDESQSAFLLFPVDLSVTRALQRAETKNVPDMPDRIIAATGLALGVPIVSRDRKIKLSDIPTIW